MKISKSGINFKIVSFISLLVSTLITLKTEGMLTLTLATTNVNSHPLI